MNDIAKVNNAAINAIYGEEDDFIIIGLTGRTGSGCTTVAKILSSEQANINHNLISYSDNTLKTNEQRKKKIIYNHFKYSWQPFLHIQASSIITTFLLDDLDNDTRIFFEKTIQYSWKIDKLHENLKKIKLEYDKVNIFKDNENSIKLEDMIKFYTKELPIFITEIKSTLGKNEYTKLYQEIGNNIRKSGNAYKNEFNKKSFFTLAERINTTIKYIHEKQKNQKTYIVIDAIRNSLEALYFEERYASFYLMAITTLEKDRISRLKNLNLSNEEIKSIDIEYNNKDNYTFQNIKECIQKADLYINNDNIKDSKDYLPDLSSQIIKFISLIRRPGIITPTAIERCMHIAYSAKLNSGCISRQVGAVITDQDYSIKSIGWNDVPQGQVPCNLRNRDDLQDKLDLEAYSDFEKNNIEYREHFINSNKKFNIIPINGRNNSFCFKDEFNKYKKQDNQVHTRSLHAEENAFLQLAKYGSNGISGGFLFTTASPCELCAKKAYQMGIIKIFYIDPYPGISLEHILQSGTKQPCMILFSGAIGKAYHKLYSPFISYKDEINNLIDILD